MKSYVKISASIVAALVSAYLFGAWVHLDADPKEWSEMGRVFTGLVAICASGLFLAVSFGES